VECDFKKLSVERGLKMCIPNKKTREQRRLEKRQHKLEMLPTKREAFDNSKEKPSIIGCAGSLLLFIFFVISVLFDKCSSISDIEVEPTSKIILTPDNP